MPPQGVWSALIAANLATTPAIPWAVPVMIAVLWACWQYLDGQGWPRSTAIERRSHLRANQMPAAVFAWAVTAGVTSIVALAGWWKLIAQVEHISGGLLPDVSKYPALTVALLVAMGSIVSPFFEQAGFWGYCQTKLEREFSAPTAILITALLFGLLPHPPTHVLLWPKLILFFLAGLTFSLMAYLTRSILPGLAVHVFSLLAFFTVVFRADTGQVRSNALLWIHGSQMIIFAILSIAAFLRVRRLTEPARRRTTDAHRTADSVAG